MLHHLQIQNYALVDNLSIDFGEGFTTITGETGSGKSVLLQALGLLVGNRADPKALKNPEEKCIVEASFWVKEYDLRIVLDDETEQAFWGDILKEDFLHIRRTILPTGKSRAYINDEPIKLEILKQIGAQILDIHSQNENHLLRSPIFCQQMVDLYADNSLILETYSKAYHHWKEAQDRYKELVEAQEKAQEEFAYHSYQLESFEGIDESFDLDKLEAEYAMGVHRAEMEANISTIQELSKGNGVIDKLDQIQGILEGMKEYLPNVGDLGERVESAKLEVEDVVQEVSRLQGLSDSDPQAQVDMGEVIGRVNGLMKRHHVMNYPQLLEKKAWLEEQVSLVNDSEAVLAEAEKQVSERFEKALYIAEEISQRRKDGALALEQKMIEGLTFLKMEQSVIQIAIETDVTALTATGIDQLKLRYAAHKNLGLQDLGTVASGGEVARIVLVLKYIIVKLNSLPTIIFDEIDTGVSGEVAEKMAKMQAKISENCQVFAITHLPQVAAKGRHQVKVYKESDDNTATTHLRILNDAERATEIAEMISGDEVTESALEQALLLLKGN